MSFLVVLYLFLGGCGGGLLFIISVWSLLYHRNSRRTTEASHSFSVIKRYSYLVGLLILVLSVACLVLDLGRPERIFFLFTRPSASLLAFGTYTLLLTLCVAVFLVIVNSFYISAISSRIKKVAEFLCAMGAFLLISYTGVYILSLKAIAFWDSLALPALFTLSSLSTGFALLFIITPLVHRPSWSMVRLYSLHALHAGIIISEAIALALFLWSAAGNPEATLSLQRLLEQEFRLWFFVGVLGFGILLPLCGELFIFFSRKVQTILLIDIMCLMGGFCLRYCLIYAGLLEL